MCKKLFPNFENTFDEFFDLVHSDLWGPAPIEGLNKQKSFVIFVDDKSRCTQIYFLKNKSETVETFKHFYSLILNQYNRCIKIIKTDNRSEYINYEMKTFIISKGIEYQTACPSNLNKTKLMRGKIVIF